MSATGRVSASARVDFSTSWIPACRCNAKQPKTEADYYSPSPTGQYASYAGSGSMAISVPVHSIEASSVKERGLLLTFLRNATQSCECIFCNTPSHFGLSICLIINTYFAWCRGNSLAPGRLMIRAESKGRRTIGTLDEPETEFCSFSRETLRFDQTILFLTFWS